MAACGSPTRQPVEGQKGPPLNPTGTLTPPRFWTTLCRSKVPFTASSVTHRARRSPYRTCPTRRLERSSWRLSSADTCRARTSGSWQGSTLARARVAHTAPLARAPRRDREAARVTLWLLGVRVARHKGRAAHHRSMYTHRIACFVRNPGAPLTTPAFVFIGEQDALIVPAMSREAATVFASAQISSSPSTGHDLPQPGDPTFDAAIAFLTRESPSSLTPLPGNGDSTAQDNSDSREPANGERDESGESVSESSAARGPRSERAAPPVAHRHGHHGYGSAARRRARRRARWRPPTRGPSPRRCCAA